jgi:hypothetical protein
MPVTTRWSLPRRARGPVPAGGSELDELHRAAASWYEAHVLLSRPVSGGVRAPLLILAGGLAVVSAHIGRDLDDATAVRRFSALANQYAHESGDPILAGAVGCLRSRNAFARGDYRRAAEARADSHPSRRARLAAYGAEALAAAGREATARTARARVRPRHPGVGVCSPRTGRTPPGPRTPGSWRSRRPGPDASVLRRVARLHADLRRRWPDEAGVGRLDAALTEAHRPAGLCAQSPAAVRILRHDPRSSSGLARDQALGALHPPNINTTPECTRSRVLAEEDGISGVVAARRGEQPSASSRGESVLDPPADLVPIFVRGSSSPRRQAGVPSGTPLSTTT